jgi:CRISPR-associated protein Csb1
MFERLENEPRILIEVALKPIQGDRFQPTGFADLGAADYVRPDGTRMLLVESVQSVANRLEATCLSGPGPRIAEELEGLPYVLVRLNGAADAETSSLVEAHRINSPYIISDKDFRAVFAEKTAYKKGGLLDWRRIAATFMFFDPSSLLHGAFMANFEDGRIRIPRALSGFIEAEDAREAASGGVKNNPLDPTGSIRAVGFDKDVYGNVPYHRTEYTARSITAYFNFDLALLAGLDLPEEARRLLLALGLYKIRRFLSTGLRLRTACDLEPADGLVVGRPTSFEVPEERQLLAAIQDGIKACGENGLFADPRVTEIRTTVVEKSKLRASEEEAAAETGGTEDDLTDGEE